MFLLFSIKSIVSELRRLTSCEKLISYARTEVGLGKMETGILYYSLLKSRQNPSHVLCLDQHVAILLLNSLKEVSHKKNFLSILKCRCSIKKRNGQILDQQTSKKKMFLCRVTFLDICFFVLLEESSGFCPDIIYRSLRYYTQVCKGEQMFSVAPLLCFRVY